MEKNRFTNQSLSKGQASDSKKTQDIATKQPRNSKRREQSTLVGFKSENSRSSSGKATPAGKTRNQTNFNYDKRSKQRPEAAGSPVPATAIPALDTTDQNDNHHEGAGLVSYDDSDSGTAKHEPNSVFSPGSKKKSLNHLMNFRIAPRAGSLYQATAASAHGTTNQYGENYDGAGQVWCDGNDSGAAKHELHSVFSPGSKKQSLNHLLNFNYTPRDRDQSIQLNKTGNIRCYVKKITYNKEQYLQANCQFVVRAGEDYTSILTTPDHLVDWTKIEQVNNFSSEEPQCPICLYPPVAAKMTKCGHIYCWPCILHYLALSDKAWRKCPICYDAIHVPDLRSCVLKPYHSYTVGEFVTFELMHRGKTSMKVENTSEVGKKSVEIPLFNSNKGNTFLTKLLLARTPEIFAIIDREQKELENQLVVDGVDCPENIFVRQALEQLKERKKNVQSGEIVSASIVSQPVCMSKSSADELSGLTAKEYPTGNAKSDEIVDMDQSSRADFMIDEDNNFSLSDIDIVPTLSCASSDYYHFYQSTDGQPLFLHSMNTRMLQAMYGSLDKSPQKITGKIVHKDSSSMSEDLRKRLKYLQHLPICTQFEVVEIEFKQDIIAPEVLVQFKGEVSRRRKDRQKRARAERIRERQIFEFNERQLGKAMARSAKINIDSTKHFPSCGTSNLYGFNRDPAFAGSTSTSEASSPSYAAGPSWSKMVSTTAVASPWPSLPSGGSMNMFGPLAAPLSKPNQVAASNTNTAPTLNNHRVGSECVDEVNNDMKEGRAPGACHHMTFAIEEALRKVSLSCDTNNTGAKKKKKKKSFRVC